MLSNIIRWCLISSEEYNSLEIKEPNFLYFLDDTKEIYRGNIDYTSSIYIVEELPEIAAKGKLYILKNTLEGNVWDGKEWKLILPGIISELTDIAIQNSLVTAEAVKTYVTQKISDLTQGIGTELNTDRVSLASKITVKGQSLGSYKDGDEILPGTTLTSILKKQFAKQIPPIYIAPTLTITPTNQTVESGTKVSPTITTIFNKNDAGAVTHYKLDKIENTETTTVVNANAIQSYKQQSIIVNDGSLLKFKATVTHDAGPIKKDNLGEPYPSTSIKAGSIDSTITYTGQRKAFYGNDKLSEPANDSAKVRALPHDYMNPVDGTKLVINISKGDTRITFAYPSSLRDVTTVLSSTLNLNVKNTFTKRLVSVEGASGYIAKEYKVYTYIPDAPFASNDTYTITI